MGANTSRPTPRHEARASWADGCDRSDPFRPRALGREEVEAFSSGRKSAKATGRAMEFTNQSAGIGKMGGGGTLKMGFGPLGNLVACIGVFLFFFFWGILKTGFGHLHHGVASFWFPFEH